MLRPEFFAIHDALHNESKPRTVVIDDIHRLIKVSKKGERYVFFRDKHEEWLLTARNGVTLVTKMFMGIFMTTERYTISKHNKPK